MRIPVKCNYHLSINRIFIGHTVVCYTCRILPIKKLMFYWNLILPFACPSPFNFANQKHCTNYNEKKNIGLRGSI